MPGHTVKTQGARVRFAARVDLLNLRSYARGVFWIFTTMRRAPHRSNAPGNRVAACVCLLAAVLLWSPLWAAAFHASDMQCCNGAMCPLHGHMPKKGSQEPAPAKESPSNCEHHSKAPAMDCTVACCQTADSTVTQAIIFVLPAPPVISAPFLGGTSTPGMPDSVNSPVFDPASPPPRVLLLPR